MRVIDRILGRRDDTEIANKLHHLEHHDALDVLTILSSDVARRRLRATTARGEEVAVALPRDQTLFDGAVLVLDEAHALVVRVGEQRWLRLVARDKADALELGYHAGNLHWRVRFDGEALLVALDGLADDYLVRLGALATEGRLTHSVVDPVHAH